MTNYIIQRVIWIFIILVTTLSITFVLLKLAPEYPPQKPDDKLAWLEKQVEDGYYTVERYHKNDPDTEQIIIDIRENEPRLNSTVFVVNPIDDAQYYNVFYRVPIAQQYLTFVKNVVTDWDWGLSTRVRVNEPAFNLIKEKIPLSLSINLAVLLFYIPFGFLFGLIAALNKDSLLDNIIQIVVMLFLSLPSLIFILLLIMFFGYYLNWLDPLFPLLEYATPGQIALGFIIPVIAGGLPRVAGFTRILRAELSEVLTSEFVLLAKTKGLSHKQAVLRHAIRNSMVPMVPIIIGSFSALVAGSFILESVYGIPGVGRVTLQAMTASKYDYNVIMSSSAFYSLIGLVTTLLVDLSYGIIDHQIRTGARK